MSSHLLKILHISLSHRDKLLYSVTHVQIQVNILNFNETVRAEEVNVFGAPLKRAGVVALHGID